MEKLPARPPEDRPRDRTEGAKAAREGCGYFAGSQVTWSRDWHGAAHLRRASDESARGGAMIRGKPPAPLARPKGYTARVKSAVGHLLTVPEFRDILNRRCAWALKVQRPACKARKRPAMSGNWHQQLRHARRVPFPKL